MIEAVLRQVVLLQIDKGGSQRMHYAFCRALRALIAAYLILLAVGAVAADPSGGTLKAIKARGAVVIGYLRDAYPMSFAGEDGQPAGYSIDICRVIAED